MVRESAVRIGLVYPELLGTYGDRGNALVLAQRCLWREQPAEVVEIAAGHPIPDSLDVYLFGGGEDAPQAMAAAGMRESRANVERARAGGAVVFAVCAGFQNLGTSYTLPDRTVIEGMGLVDAVTVAGSPRLIGEVVVEPEPPLPRLTPPLPRLTGFENHGGRTTLGPGVRPLGRVIAGGGIGAGTGVDGVHGDRLLATYLHGPVLPRNPGLADYLLAWILGDLTPLDSVWEERLRTERLEAGAKSGIGKWIQDRLLARG
jgi:CobQ-like glutamine amidotransferase family enzyme